MDVQYMAQSPLPDENLLVRIDRSLSIFHENKDIILSLGARMGTKKPIDNLFIPKLELMQSITASSRKVGALIQWSADTTEHAHISKIKDPVRHTNNNDYDPQICPLKSSCAHSNSEEFLENEVDEEDDEDCDELTDPRTALLEELNHTCITTKYFSKARQLVATRRDNIPHPPRTFVAASTTIHLNFFPTHTGLKIDEVTDDFNIPDLRQVLSDFLQCNTRNGEAGHGLGVPRRSLIDRPLTLPFEHIQVWHVVCLQQVSFHNASVILPAQTVHASPPSPISGWPKGQWDAVLINVDQAYDWPKSGLMEPPETHPDAPHQHTDTSSYQTPLCSTLSNSESSCKLPMATTSLFKLPEDATSFDLYLCGASLSSAGFPPIGGRTVSTVKGLLRSELDGKVIDESNLKKMKFTDSIFCELIRTSSLQLQHINKIKYHKKDGSSVYTQKKWNFNWRKKSKTKDPESIDTDATDLIDSDEEVEGLDSHGSTIFSQGTDGTWSDDEYKGSENTGSKRKRKKRLTERDLQYLFHAIQWALRNRSGYPMKLPFEISPIERYWSAEFANSPIQDPYNAQKPDVALFYYKNKHREKTWADVLSFMEHTSSNLTVMHDLAVYWRSATKAYLIMQEQPWRCFVLAYSICTDDLHAHYFDCLGLIISLPTPIHKFPICVTEAVATTALADPQYLGLNPTIHMCIPDCQGTHPSLAVGAKGWVINNSGKTYLIMDTLWKSQGFFCHRTVCYCIRDPTNPDGKDYVMKDCWVPEAKRYHEVDVLERVKGIPNVIELMDHWDVMCNGEPDCTAWIHNRYQQFNPEDRDDHRFCNQFHWRIVMTPCGELLSDFSSRKELICAFRDFVVAHRLMVKRGILHGDLSPNNFIIYEGIGYFIDFYHAGFIEKGKASTISFGTGIILYISMHVLKMMCRNAETMKKTADANQLHPIKHHVCDDLESMFYIFFEYVAKYGGHMAYSH
ncbi:uncharacterized protein F5891DRAFT_1187471 [Suillus fuscotomentosus]|uniref:Protein kinase domain-containing protein n=1 Tax=Suillus fuscotomentosus TaxID=1912939 RepID=A0AAD4E8C2_9AGAM|nr:uncharacterized protein F5891DRAFT_1187471 [Suillus fuscotomentosus]KAG1901600.1 hypothetical protein F5891DRAFT_1187471 [Suillus fuscotomentosus]